jgi:hypothetical protein
MARGPRDAAGPVQATARRARPTNSYAQKEKGKARASEKALFDLSRQGRQGSPCAARVQEEHLLFCAKAAHC